MQTNSPENTEFSIVKLELNFVLQFAYVVCIFSRKYFSAGFFEVIINCLSAYFMLC